MSEAFKERCRLCGESYSRNLVEEHSLLCQGRARPPRPKLQPVGEATRLNVQTGNYWREERKQNEPENHPNEAVNHQRFVENSNPEKQAQCETQSTGQQEKESAPQNSPASILLLSSQNNQDDSSEGELDSIRPATEPAHSIVHSVASSHEQQALRCARCDALLIGSRARGQANIECPFCRDRQNQESDSSSDSQSSVTIRLFRLIVANGNVRQAEGNVQAPQHPTSPIRPFHRAEQRPAPPEEAGNRIARGRPQPIQPNRRRLPNPEDNSDSPRALPPRSEIENSLTSIVLVLDIAQTMMMIWTGDLIHFLMGEEEGLDQNSRDSLTRLKFQSREGANELCAICQENFEDGDDLLRLHCRHDFHDHCLDPWLEAHTTCPLCKQDQNIVEHID